MALGELDFPEFYLSDEEEMYRYNQLKENLIHQWDRIKQLNPFERTIIVLPSITLETSFSGDELSAYEERFLFLCFLLKQPLAKVIFFTSKSIPDEIVDYYLSTLPGVIQGQARKRLFLVSPEDSSSTPLTLKILQRPHLINKVKSLITDVKTSHIIPFVTTKYEKELAIKLGVPIYGSDPDKTLLESKSMTRKVFKEAGVPCPMGFEDIYDKNQIKEGITALIRRDNGIKQVLTKLNNTVSGQGIAKMDVSQLDVESAKYDQELDVVIENMSFELIGETVEKYLQKMMEKGAVLEEFLEGDRKESPSVQLRITPLNELEVLSTHDQILGGEGGTYQGCKFPANKEYGKLITDEAVKIGSRLIEEGLLGRFAIDFVVIKNQGQGWRPYAIETNIRKGGTTHPFLTLQFLTEGNYLPDEVSFIAPCGGERYFIANDSVKYTNFRCLTPSDLFEIVTFYQLHYDPLTQIGVIFHMISAISTLGRVGFTAIGRTEEEAKQFYDDTVRLLKENADHFANEEISY